MKHVGEEQLALYAWGDLPPQDYRGISDHLQTCDHCQRLLSEFQETRSFVTASLQNPEVDELSEVRARLTVELQTQQRRASLWAWWGAGAAAALALFTLPHVFEQRPDTAPEIKPSRLTVNVDPGPTLQIPLVPIATSRPKHLWPQRAGIRSLTLLSQANRASVIKMTTADPNVVILWQLNEEAER